MGLTRRAWPLVVLVVAVGAGCGASEVADPTSTSVTTSHAVPSTSTSTTVPPVASWSVVVVGDFGTGDAAEHAVADQIRRWVSDHPDTAALVTTGDNFYLGDVASAWQIPYGWLAPIPVFAAAGNHDIESIGQWLANREAFGGFPGWRRVTIGDTAFVILDSNQVDDARQQAWLEDQADRLTGTPWVAVFHHPWHSCSHHGSTPAVESRWGRALAGATLVLNGHDHGYQRFATSAGWSIVTGGGGRPIHHVGSCPEGTEEPVAAADALHFIALHADANGWSIEAIDVAGTVLDRVVLPAPPGETSRP